MNTAQKDQILPLLEIVTGFDITAIAVSAHGKDADPNQIVYDSYSLIDIDTELQLIIRDLVMLFTTDRWKWAPFNYNAPLVGENNVFNHVNHIKTQLETNRPFGEIGQSVVWLRGYLIGTGNYGIARKEKRNIITDEELERERTMLAIIKEQVELRAKENNELRDSLNKQQVELQNFYTQKQAELKAISEALAAVSGQKAEIDNVHKAVLNADNDIRTKFKNQEDLLAQLNSQKETQKKEFEAILQTIEEQKGKLVNTLSDSDVKLKFFEGLETFVKDKQKEIVELGALAAGAALGGTFGLRKDTLETETNSWKKWIPIATAGALIWIIVVFTCLGSVTSNVWIDTILKLAKTIPAFVLMGFVFKQYTKERNLQEEYAFKSAVANTIKAYSDLLKGEDNESNKSKQAMLLEAIKRVQSPPKLGNESNGRMFSFSTRNLAKSIEQLNESIKNIKP